MYYRSGFYNDRAVNRTCQRRRGMGGDTDTERVVRELEAALAAEDLPEKNYHVRQALQLLSVE